MRIANVAAALVAAPVAVLAVAWPVVLVMAATGTHPIWTVTPRNLAEAAAFRDGAAIVRLVESGVDPKAKLPVRPGVIADEAVTLTAMEAASEARRAELVQLLFDLGLGLDQTSWTNLWCDATDSDVRTVLASHRPEGIADPQCPAPASVEISE